MTILLCFLTALCEGIDLQAAGVAAGGIRQEFHPGNQLLSYFFSASTIGLLFGAIIGGRVADRVGRKRVLLYSTTAFGLFSLLTALAWDVHALTAARLLTGLGLGGALPNLVALGSENAPAHRRSAFVTMIYSGTPLGGAVASLVSLLTAAPQWRWIFIVGGIAPLLVAPLIAFRLPESVAFGRRRDESPSPADRASGVSAVLGNGQAARTLLLWVSFFFALLTLYLLLNWLPTLLGTSGFDRISVASSMIGFNLSGCLAALYIGFHLESNLRHRGVIAVFVGLPVLLLVLAAGSSATAIVIVVVCALGAAVVAAQAILYAYAPLCYPTRIRATGVGFAVAMGRVGSIAGPLLGGLLLGSGRTPSQVLEGILPIAVVGGCCAIALAWRQPPALKD
jgi:AAHS family 3-hydroxyphenylpropionic acid transporter